MRLGLAELQSYGVLIPTFSTSSVHFRENASPSWLLLEYTSKKLDHLSETRGQKQEKIDEHFCRELAPVSVPDRRPGGSAW